MFSKWVEWELRMREKESWLKIKRRLPRVPQFAMFRHFNFILLHYMYLIFLTILGSVMLYGPGGMDYIDALFFASGASTQSGLNTININQLLTYQQVVLILIACIANPIWINTMVVFIRLYWFEKRFQHVVQDARSWRRTRTRSRTKSEMRHDPDHDKEERGVGGREIRVVRSANGDANIHGKAKSSDDESDSDIAVQGMARGDPVQGEGHPPEKRPDDTPTSPRTESPTQRRDIVWADEVRPSRGDHNERLPQQRTREENIAFLEKQRNPKSKSKLRVPGPRDYDRGEVPRQVDDDDDDINRTVSGDDDQPVHNTEKLAHPDDSGELNMDDHPLKSELEDHKHINWLPNLSSMLPHRSRTDVADEDGEAGMELRRRGPTRSFASFLSTKSEERDPIPYLSYAPTIGRNSLFIDLTEEQREELGGVEYRALKTLAWILSIYYLGFHVFGIICLLPWILHSRWGGIVKSDGQSTVWWGFFTPMSMFTDLGFTLTPDSMISFQYAIFPLLLGSFLIVIGNTGFPCMLRFVIWALSKCVTYGTPLYEELRFLLDHPRRCFTLLFPKQATWWLFFILVLLNGIDIVFFIILDLKDTTVTVLPGGIRFVNGVFQAFSTRTAGFACVNLADLHPAIQVSYLVMMYISVFPIAISVRRTNVYEEKSLGVYPQDEDDNGDAQQSYIGAHLRRQLSFDLWYVFLGLFIICIVEGNRLESTSDLAFTIFNCLFEIVSAYGTVGLSLGYPGIDASFSAEFRTLSKLIIIAMQIRGRHRGLPYALDRAILLPSESLHRKEAEEAARRAQQARKNSGLADAEHGDGTGAGREGTGLRSRRNSTGTFDAHRRPTFIENFDLKRQQTGLARIVSGALSAGPSSRKSRQKNM